MEKIRLFMDRFERNLPRKYYADYFSIVLVVLSRLQQSFFNTLKRKALSLRYLTSVKRKKVHVEEETPEYKECGNRK
jgi:hypothetical protein